MKRDLFYFFEGTRSIVWFGGCTCALLLFFGTTTYGQTQAFEARNYGGKCLDFGSTSAAAGSPVYISDCNRGASQQIRIEEINDKHEVLLHAGSKVIGARGIYTDFVTAPFTTIGASTKMPLAMTSLSTRPLTMAPVTTAAVNTANAVTVTKAQVFFPISNGLELQDQPSALSGPSAAQVFALDGDSILLASNHTLAVQVQNSRGKNQTPLILADRALIDAEFWMLSAIDGSNADPTTGFVHVSQAQELVNALQQATGHPGTVIEVAQDVSIDLENIPTLEIGYCGP
jgi:hypothetical protein